MVKLDSIQSILDVVAKYGFWAIFLMVFVIFGMKHVAPILAATGRVFNDRHKANLSHKRDMLKIDNQIASKKDGKK